MNKATTMLALLCAVAFAQQKGTFTDQRDRKTYKTVKIGEQTWMAENLNYEAKGSKCYDNKPANCDKYGRLYLGLEAKNNGKTYDLSKCSNGFSYRYKGSTHNFRAESSIVSGAKAIQCQKH